MGVAELIKRVGRDTIVYWSSPVPTASGKNSFATPVEIKGVWVDKTELFNDMNGKEVASNAVVFVSQDLDEQGMLYLGTLKSLTATQQADPTKVKRAFEIKRFLRVPSMYKKGVRHRRALLGHREQ